MLLIADIILTSQLDRTEILRHLLGKLPPAIGAADPARLAVVADGLTGADLKQVVEDGRILFARDRARGLERRPAEEYFVKAIETVRASKYE